MTEQDWIKLALIVLVIILAIVIGRFLGGRM